MLKRFQTFFRRVVDHVEAKEVPFVQHLLLFASILAVRLALEYWSSRKLFTVEDVLHISLWFTGIVLSFMLLLQLFSGQPILRIARLVITFFSIALTAPLLDLALSGGQGFKMNYMALNPGPGFEREVLWAYLTLGGSSLERGATPGIRIEIALLVLASFNYIRTRRESWVLGIIGAITIYTTLFLSGALPLFLTQLNKWLGITFQSDDRSTVMLLLTLDLGLLLLVFLRHLRGRAGAFWGQVTWLKLGGAASLLFAGWWKGRELYPDNGALNPTTLYHWPLAILLLLAIGGAVALHRSGNPKAMRILWMLLLAVGTMVNYRVMFAAGVWLGLLQMHGQEPLLLRKVPGLGHLLEACLFLAIPLAGFALAGAPMIGFPAAWLAAGLALGLCNSLLWRAIGGSKKA
jgi:nicotinamide riboside transporter PnuC